MKSENAAPRDNRIFLSSVFFVLGFSVVFSLVGVLLQGALASISYSVQQILARVGGTIIILFGLFLLGLLKLPFLEQDHKLRVKRRFSSVYATSFVFGAAFAVGWTPCVGAVLGAILTLAATQSGSAFLLLFSYSLGLGIPFLLVGLFTEQAKHFIKKSARMVFYLNKAFGAVLIIIGVYVFTNQLSRIANFQVLTSLLLSLDGGISLASLNIGIAFLAGLVSFLSPCVLPIIPGFLSYLAATHLTHENT
ncbi:MAG: cytochrome c-type biogenesis protein [archaeon GW2011_AR4]|nr:MAG: cytochrome c-type biogenesis protein [archaeon GW2011_AR4]